MKKREKMVRKSISALYLAHKQDFVSWLFNAGSDSSKLEGVLGAHALPVETGMAACDDGR